MSKITSKEFEFDIEQLKAADKGGRLLLLETICPQIFLEGLNHKEIIAKFEEIKLTALSIGYNDYKLIEDVEEYSDFTTLIAVVERPETEEEYEQRLVKTAYKKKKQQIAYRKKAKLKKSEKQLKKFNNFYDDIC
jgi:hypothetical protein